MKYLIIGVYEDDDFSGRWADSYEAASPEEAEAMAAAEHPDVIIAGVVAMVDGEMTVVA